VVKKTAIILTKKDKSMNTISEREEAASALFEVLRKIPLSPELSETRDYLFPEGLSPVVQLEEDGRKKRSSAAAWNWNAKTGEIRIYLEPIAAAAEPQSEVPAAAPPSPVEAASAGTQTDAPAPTSIKVELTEDGITSQEVIECCQALAAAERSNRQFIALKWFRDDFLATVDFRWAKEPQRRQRVLSHTIDLGRIDAKKIPNPKSNFPTTTISLNRLIPTPGVAPRFQPIAVRGEPVSVTLLRDRGSV
jgi:hypothetical protein